MKISHQIGGGYTVYIYYPSADKAVLKPDQSMYVYDTCSESYVSKNFSIIQIGRRGMGRSRRGKRGE
jgi:hypothetical protein